MSTNGRMLRVERMTRLANDVVEVRLVDAAGALLPGWEPGAHIVLHLADELERQYSLCGPAGERRSWTVAVHRSPTTRGGSAHIHDRLRVGSSLRVEGPFNNFPLAEADRYLLLAGGIGITPILAMARQLRETGAAFELVYCARSRSMMAYADELEGWSNDQVVLRADDEHGGRLDVGELLRSRPDALVYCCGPEGLISAVEEQAPDPGLVHVERFRAVPQPESLDEANSSFHVVLAGSGQRVHVNGTESILDALGRAGHDVPSSCREGICGTCETKVIAGTPEHRDSVLTAAERAANCSMMICVSRTRDTEIVLDL